MIDEERVAWIAAERGLDGGSRVRYPPGHGAKKAKGDGLTTLPQSRLISQFGAVRSLGLDEVHATRLVEPESHFVQFGRNARQSGAGWARDSW